LKLTEEDEQILGGEQGGAYQKAMEILKTLGEIYNADSLVDIKSVQIAGVSYKTIGDAGIQFLKDILNEGEEDVKVRVPTTLNPAGIDIEKWKELGFPNYFAEKQMEILDIFRKIGVNIECTCTPYLVGNRPDIGDHLAWSESSAVSFANSVLGARTNREGGPSALSAALIGKVPRYGYHIDENRRPNIKVKIPDAESLESSEYGALGRIIGRTVQDEIPYFYFGRNPGPNELKSLGASMAATGAVAMYHVDDLTPESGKYPIPDREVTVSIEEIREEYIEVDSKVDLVAIGCPHLSYEELVKISRLLGDHSVKIDTWIFTSRYIKKKHPKVVEKIEKSGAKIVSDTCMVVAPLDEMGYETVMVDSGKASSYLPNLEGIDVIFNETKKCVERALNGY